MIPFRCQTCPLMGLRQQVGRVLRAGDSSASWRNRACSLQQPTFGASRVFSAPHKNLVYCVGCSCSAYPSTPLFPFLCLLFAYQYQYIFCFSSMSRQRVQQPEIKD
ncbi:hypothetical protein M407DRAFT_106040 [Tulasnella calospora MUT 4182]|uniref:Uncharacterized protein n=1 Tax=Tulasnella calospora MUT 4182 TaxID=1051891 RepID=A0A0C3LR98_9AGAM|nr:hypothetical protein M407DRAFT_106040 [Tulasnella calospora MUT 4182]